MCRISTRCGLQARTMPGSPSSTELHWKRMATPGPQGGHGICLSKLQLGQDSSQESPPIRVYPELTTLLREHAAGAIAGEEQAGVAIRAFPATCRALRAIAGHLCPLQEKPLPQAGDVLVAIPPGSHKNRHESEEAARRDAALDVAAREIPAVAEPDEGGAVAGQAVKPSRRLRLGLCSSLLALLKESGGAMNETLKTGAGQPVASGRLMSTTCKDRFSGKMLSTRYTW